MRLKSQVVLFTSYLMGQFISLGFAAEPINLRHINYQKIQPQFSIVVPGASKAPALPNSKHTLRLIRQHQDLQHITHFRLQQQYMGFDVVGGYAIAHAKSSNKNVLLPGTHSKMSGIIYTDLEGDLGASPPTNYLEHSKTALKTFAAHYPEGRQGEGIVEPVIYIDSRHQAHWAYRVSLTIQKDKQMPEKPTAIIDAQTLTTYIQWNDIKTSLLSSVRGKGFGGNQKTQPIAYNGAHYPYLEITRNNTIQSCYLSNLGVKVIDMKHEYVSEGNSMKFPCAKPIVNSSGVYWTGYEEDGYDRINGGYSPSNDALYFGYVINHLYKDWYGVNALTYADGSPMRLVMRVHFGEAYDNAFWDGAQMTFGDGAFIFYPLVSLGVGAHEISHGFTEQHADLLYFGESGAMNESFSDMAAQAAEYYVNQKSSWKIGAEIVKEGSGYEALRFMDRPSRDGASIDNAEDYYEGLDVHYASGVYNRLFYLMATHTGWSTKRAFDVMIKANMDYWTPYATFGEGACGILSAAYDLNYTLSDVKDALKRVKVDYHLCDFQDS